MSNKETISEAGGKMLLRRIQEKINNLTGEEKEKALEKAQRSIYNMSKDDQIILTGFQNEYPEILDKNKF